MGCNVNQSRYSFKCDECKIIRESMTSIRINDCAMSDEQVEMLLQEVKKIVRKQDGCKQHKLQEMEE